MGIGTPEQIADLEAMYSGGAIFRAKAQALADSAKLICQECKDQTSKPRANGYKPSDGKQHVGLLLWGLSIEVLLKGILFHHKVASGVARLEAAKSVGGYRHNLPKLAQDSGLSIDSTEAELLRVLKGFVVWAGKYAGPNNAGEVPTSSTPLIRTSFKATWKFAERFYEKAKRKAKADKRASNPSAP